MMMIERKIVMMILEEDVDLNDDLEDDLDERVDVAGESMVGVDAKEE